MSDLHLSKKLRSLPYKKISALSKSTYKNMRIVLIVDETIIITAPIINIQTPFTDSLMCVTNSDSFIALEKIKP